MRPAGKEKLPRITLICGLTRKVTQTLMPETRRVQRVALVVLFPESVGKHGEAGRRSNGLISMFSSALWEQDGGQRPTLRAVGPSVRNRRQFAQLAKFVAYAFPETLTSLVFELQGRLLPTEWVISPDTKG